MDSTGGYVLRNLGQFFRLVFLTVATVLTPVIALAQECSGIPGLVTNGGFELPDVTLSSPAAVQVFGSPPNVVKIYNEGDVPGWETTAADNRIELWRSGFGGVASYEGNQHAEINANLFGAFFQDLATTPNTTVLWSFAHRGRAGVDTVEVLIGSPGGTLVSQGQFSTGNGGWDVKSGSYTVPVGQTVTRFQFLAVSTAAGNPSVGNFVDAVRITPDCDYGDAPASFPVLRSNNGAAHRLEIGSFLGSSIDVETDGQPGATADGDDNLGADDEDGVIYGPDDDGNLNRGQTNPVDITASIAGFVNLWVDLNGDGDWQASERLLNDTPVSAGTQALDIAIPLSSSLGPLAARVRYSTTDPGGTMGPGGDWPNGEVEDAFVTVVVPPPGLSVTKTATATGFTDGDLQEVPVGTVITYVYRVENTGEVAISDIHLNDIHNGLNPTPLTTPSNETLDPGDSSPGSSDTVNVQLKLTLYFHLKLTHRFCTQAPGRSALQLQDRPGAFSDQD